MQLANRILDLNLDHHILSLLLLQPIIHLNDAVPLGKAGLIKGADSFSDVVNGIEHDFSSQEVTNLELSLNVVLFPLTHDVCDFRSPSFSDALNDVDSSDLLSIC